MINPRVLLLPEYNNEISRSRLRFCGIGPRMIEDDQKGRIWPRDEIDLEKQVNIFLYPDLINSINNPQQVADLKIFIRKLFSQLRKCNLKNLFEYCCPPDKAHESLVDVGQMMQAFTTYNQILDFIHQILRSIKIDSSRRCQILELFGSNKNFDVYKMNLKLLVTGNSMLTTMREGYFIHFGSKSMDLNKVAWLAGLDELTKYQVFLQFINRLNWFVTQTIRRYFYITISNPYHYKLFYYRYDLWQRLEDHAMQLYLASGLLQKVRLDEPADLNSIHYSKIRFHLKLDDLRLICISRFNTYDHHFQLQAALDYIIRNMPHTDKYRTPRELLDGIKNMQDISVKLKQPIFIVRADMEDCFHSIDQTRLASIVMNFLRAAFPHKKLAFQKLEYRLKNNRKQVCRWSLSPDEDIRRFCPRYLDIQKLFKPKVFDLDEFERLFIEPMIMTPILKQARNSKVVYKMINGIRQGARSSPKLCGIYIREAFNATIPDLLDSNDSRCFIHVDDILFMTTCKAKAEKFLDTMIEGIANFNLRSNSKKLAANFVSERHSVEQFDKHVQFYRRKIDIRTLACSYSFSTEDVGIENMFALNPYTDERQLRETTKKLTKLDPVFLDYDLNGPQQVFRNIHESASFVAHRVAASLSVSLVFRDLANQQPSLIIKLTKIVSKKVISILKAGLKYYGVVNRMNDSEIFLLVTSAFLATWKLKRVRHRKRELDRLDKHFNRLMMRYLIFHDACESDIRGVNFEKLIREFICDFQKSSFFKDVLLPLK